MKKLLLANIILILCTFQLFGQPIEKKNIFISGGFGLPELLNISASYNVNQFRAGIFAGILPTPYNNIFSVGGDVYYHFAGKDELTELKPWYLKASVNLLQENTSNYTDKYIYANLRAGYLMFNSKTFGLDMYFGGSYQLSYNRISKSNQYRGDLFFDIPFRPSIGFGIFYRL
jgi:hypothetical protein